MACDTLTLFELDETEPPEVKARRNPARVPATRSKPQLHLPVFTGEEAEITRLEEFAEEHRPLQRGECLEEARPCPWVSCRWHLYHARFEEFATLIDMIPDSDDDLRVDGALEQVFGEGPAATEATGKRGPAEAVPGEAIAMTAIRPQSADEPELRGPWPTCALDVADDVMQAGKALGQTSVAALAGVTREAVRQIQFQAAEFVAVDPAMRDFLLDGLTSQAKVDAARERNLDKYGDGER